MKSMQTSELNSNFDNKLAELKIIKQFKQITETKVLSKEKSFFYSLCGNGIRRGCSTLVRYFENV